METNDLSFYDVLHNNKSTKQDISFYDLYQGNATKESSNLYGKQNVPTTGQTDFNFGDMFKDTKTSMQSIGLLGSAIGGVGSVIDAFQKGKYQKKILEFAKQDRENALKNQQEATKAVGTAFADVFGKK